MKYRESNYFNTEDTYRFMSNLDDTIYECKVEFYNGNFYTTHPKFTSQKATSIRCEKVS